MAAKIRKSHSLTSAAICSVSSSSDGGSTRSGDTTPKSRSRSSSRSMTVAAAVLRNTAAFSTLPTVHVSVLPSSVDVRVKAVVTGSKVEGKGLPEVIVAGKTADATYSTSIATRGFATKGRLLIEGFEPVAFSVAHCDQGSNFVASKGKWRHTVFAADYWDWRNHGDKPTEGKAAELEVLGMRISDKAPTVKLHVRAMTEMELKRFLQARALEEAAEGEDYDTLHAQIQKAKMQGVEAEKIERGEERLRDLRRRGLHVSEGCDKETLRAMMQWENVTRHPGAQCVNEPCPADECCPCNVDRNPGEVLEVAPGAVNECLAAQFGPDGDRLFFEELVNAALAVEEGCVWRAGGKFIFSAFDRNQSVSALTRMLHNHGAHKCAKMLLAMVTYSEKKYVGYVTSIQVNFHPHCGTYHAQHRDIYSAKQRAGPNCTCSFRRCVGTVCYTVGSSRRCQLETMTDELSTIAPCGDECQGRREYMFLNSGDAMFFNEAWNSNHTHGIPAMNPGEECGPRISVAFLLGAEDDRPNMPHRE